MFGPLVWHTLQAKGGKIFKHGGWVGKKEERVGGIIETRVIRV